MYGTAVVLLAMVIVFLMPLKAMALMPLFQTEAGDTPMTLSMGGKPTQSVSKEAEVKPRQTVSHGLKKISIRDIAHSLGPGDSAAMAVSAVDQLLKGKSLAPRLTLKTTSPDNTVPEEFSARFRKQSTDPSGKQHVRVNQTYKGLPVVGAEVIVHINAYNQIYRMTGKYLPMLDISVEPAITAQDALAVGMQDIQDKTGAKTFQEPMLVIYGQRLAFHFIIAHRGPEVGQWRYYVDAQSGEVIWRYNDVHSVAPGSTGSYEDTQGRRLVGEDGQIVDFKGWHDTASGNYFLHHAANNWGVYDIDAFDWEQQATADWDTNDPAAISAANNFSLIQDYVETVLGRNSFDDANGFAKINVHEGDNLVNAYWYMGEFWFGDGDGADSSALSVMDVAAHEYAHALTQYTSNLIYENASGALNEAYSDIFGALVEFWVQEDGTDAYPDSIPAQSDWLIGEDCWLAGQAIRNLQDPRSYGYPSYYKGSYWQDYALIPNQYNDYGGVHTNSGVLYHAFYLLAEGGSGTNDGYPYDLTGIGITNAGQIAMHANLAYHTSMDDYLDARQAWIDAATDLGHSTDVVEDVFDAVGVGGATAHRVIFDAGNGGQIIGYASQIVPVASDALPVGAQPDSGYVFSGWTGDYSSTDNPLTLTNVTGEMTIAANFTKSSDSDEGQSSDDDGSGGGSGCFLSSIGLK
jgi:thermolysin